MKSFDSKKAQLTGALLILFFTIFSTSTLIAGQINVEAGVDAISTALAGAAAGDTLVLVTNGGAYTESGAVTINKDITIMAADTLDVIPIWTTSGAATEQIDLQSGNVMLKGIVFDGENVASRRGVIIRAPGVNIFHVYDCEFKNLTAEAIYTDAFDTGTAAIVDSMWINSTTFHHVDAAVKADVQDYIYVKDVTIYKTNGDGINVVGHGTGNGTVADISHATINEVALTQDGGASIKLKNFGGDAAGTVLHSCAIANAVTNGLGVNFENGVGGDTLTVTYSVLWNNSGGNFAGDASAGWRTFIENPRFHDAENGDFRYINSRLAHGGMGRSEIGDTGWRRSDDGPPYLAVNAIGPGTVTIAPTGPIYNVGDVVTLTAVPDAGAEFLGWLGDYASGSDLTATITMDANKYVTAQFAPMGAQIVTVDGVIGGEDNPRVSQTTDWSFIALELKASTEVTHEETQTGKVDAGGSDTLTVSSATLTGVAGDLYLAAISTKGFSHGHIHNTSQVISISGLGLAWTHVTSQRGTRNATHLELYKAQGTPTGDGAVTATVHTFPAGQNVVISVTRYSGVDAANPIGNVIGVNTQGFEGPVVEITGYPRPSSSHDKPNYSVNLPLEGTGGKVCAFVAHRNKTHIPGEVFVERSEFLNVSPPASPGDRNSISVVDNVAPFFTLTVNTVGSGQIVLDPPAGNVALSSATVTFEPGIEVTAEAVPAENWLFNGWSGDLSGMDNPQTLTMDGNKSISATFLEGEIIDLKASFSHTVDYVVIAAELRPVSGDTVTHEETQSGIIEGATADTVTVITDAALTAIAGDMYLAVVSTKKRSQVVSVGGLGLDWSFVRDQEGARDQTYLSLWKAKGTPTGDEAVWAKATNVRIGKDVALAVSRYSGVDTMASVLVANTFGYTTEPDSTLPHIGGIDIASYTIPFHKKVLSAAVYTAVAHRLWGYEPAPGHRVRALVEANPGTGNTASVTVADYLYHPIEVAAAQDAISTAFAVAPDEAFLVLTSAGPYFESTTLVIDKDVYIVAGEGVTPLWRILSGTEYITLKADLALKGLAFNGGDAVDHVINNLADTPNDVVVSNCEFQRMANDIIANDSGNIKPMNSLSVANSIFFDSHAGVVLDGDINTGVPGAWKFRVENSTFYNMGDEGIKLEAYVPAGVDSVVPWINHVTVNNCGGEAVYFKGVSANSVVTNSIATNSNKGVRVKEGSPVVVTYSDIWNNVTDFTDDATAGMGTISEDPIFADAPNGNFDFATDSPVVGTASDGGNMGDPRWKVDPTVSVESKGTVPDRFELSQNYPNPFNPSTNITFAVPVLSKVKLTIYSVLGQKVRTLRDEEFTPGYYSLIWDGKNEAGLRTASGVYFYRLEAEAIGNTPNKFVQVKKMLLLK